MKHEVKAANLLREVFVLGIKSGLVLIEIFIGSTDGDDGSFFAPWIFVADRALCLWVQDRMSIGKEQIVMMSMMKFHLYHPATVGRFSHWRGIGFPFVESPDNTDFLSFRGVAEKIDRPDGFLGRITRIMTVKGMGMCGHAGETRIQFLHLIFANVGARKPAEKKLIMAA